MIRHRHRLTVEADGTTIHLNRGQELIFGRDTSCGLQLDPTDTGISRLAGRISHDGNGWTVTNLSHKRALHIVDATGFAVPLPVKAEGGPAGRRLIDPPRVMVLVPGDLWTHAIMLSQAERHTTTTSVQQPNDPLSTTDQTPNLTDRRREVLVAMARGYLRRYPHYDPQPLTYQQVADLLGLTKAQVRRRVEDVRDELVRAGVQGLEHEVDARRPLCEWLLAMRIIGPADLAWLQSRMQHLRQTPRRSPDGAAA